MGCSLECGNLRRCACRRLTCSQCRIPKDATLVTVDVPERFIGGAIVGKPQQRVWSRMTYRHDEVQKAMCVSFVYDFVYTMRI